MAKDTDILETENDDLKKIAREAAGSKRLRKATACSFGRRGDEVPKEVSAMERIANQGQTAFTKAIPRHSISSGP